MITTAEFKTGLTIEFDGNIYQIIEFMHVKPGKGAAFVRSKLKNLRTGATIDYTFPAGVKVEKAQIDKINVQFLYVDGNSYVFMDTDSYDQISLDRAQILYETKFLYEGLKVQLMMYNQSEVLGVILPDKIVLEVTETEPGVRGDTKTTANKDAILETGLLVKVPLFIETGDRLVISTADGSYVSREK